METDLFKGIRCCSIPFFFAFLATRSLHLQRRLYLLVCFVTLDRSHIVAPFLDESNAPWLPAHRNNVKKLWLLINLERSEPNPQPKMVRTRFTVAYLFFQSIAGESYCNGSLDLRHSTFTGNPVVDIMSLNKTNRKQTTKKAKTKIERLRLNPGKALATAICPIKLFSLVCSLMPVVACELFECAVRICRNN